MHTAHVTIAIHSNIQLTLVSDSGLAVYSPNTTTIDHRGQNLVFCLFL